MAAGRIPSAEDGGDNTDHTFYRGANATGPASTVQVLHGVLRGPQVVDVADGRQVQAPGGLGSGYQQAALVVSERVQRLQREVAGLGGAAVLVRLGVPSSVYFSVTGETKNNKGPYKTDSRGHLTRVTGG